MRELREEEWRLRRRSVDKWGFSTSGTAEFLKMLKEKRRRWEAKKRMDKNLQTDMVSVPHSSSASAATASLTGAGQTVSLSEKTAGSL